MPDLYLIEFKGHRRGYFYNAYYHSLESGDRVIVEAERGEDMGRLSKPVGDEKRLGLEDKPPSILRPATDDDIAYAKENETAEKDAMYRCQDLVAKHALPMKLIDSEYQHDRNKLTFYFTSDQRVDFRALVRDLASIYRTRIELRQIGVRDAARRIGGFGVCGLVQCCCSFLKKFEPISTQYAREQNLSLNPSKISGNCGRLLCCLFYEREHYTEALSKFPARGDIYKTDKGDGVIDAINIFENYMLLKHASGEFEKLTLSEIQKRQCGRESIFKRLHLKSKPPPNDKD